MRKISKRDWATYQGFYGAILDAIRPPDLMIYLRCSMRPLRQRIRLRGRKMEQDVPLAYLKRLERLYDSWIESYDMSDVLVLETDDLDYIHDLVHRLDVMKRIEAVCYLCRTFDICVQSTIAITNANHYHLLQSYGNHQIKGRQLWTQMNGNGIARIPETGPERHYRVGGYDGSAGTAPDDAGPCRGHRS